MKGGEANDRDRQGMYRVRDIVVHILNNREYNANNKGE